MNEIRPIGSFLPIDAYGYIVNPTSFDKIQENWLPVVEELREEYIKQIGTRLHSLYLRGSVAKGEAIEGISDIDSFAVVFDDASPVTLSWAAPFRAAIKTKYPFVTGIEIGTIPLAQFAESRVEMVLIKTQSICLYGENLAEHIMPMRPGPETIIHLSRLGSEIANTKQWFAEDHSEAEMRQKCTWLMKRIVRSGMEVLMERLQKYTRDLYPCYIAFSENFPEKKEEMYRALSLAVSPTASKQELLSVLDGIGTWLCGEAQKL